MTNDMKFYLSLVLKRLPVMMVIFVLCSAIGVAVSISLPARYTSDATLLIESPQIADNLAASTVQIAATEQLQLLQQAVMTRRNLIDIANKYGVFNGQSRMSPDQVVQTMRELTTIRTASRRNSVPRMTISFSASNAQQAANVVGDYVTLMLAEDARRRSRNAGGTLEFFEQEIERLDLELAEKSAEILAFKEANKDALPDELGYRLERQSTLQERLNLSARDIAAYNEQRTRLMAIGVPTAGAPEVRLSPEQERLRALEAELTAALTVYSETNPKVTLLKSQVEQLEALVAGQMVAASGTETTEVSSDPAQAMLDLQLAEIDSRVQFLEEERARTEAELTRIEAAIERTPGNAIQLEALDRDYDNIQRLYDEAARSLAKAQTGARIEDLSVGSRLTVTEQPVAPSEPNSPNRQLIAGGGVIAGSGLAALFFVLTELINRSIRRPVDLVRSLGIQPLATIPYLEEERVSRRRRAILTILTVGVILAIPIGLWAIHTFYLPLDLVVEKVLDKIGL